MMSPDHALAAFAVALRRVESERRHQFTVVIDVPSTFAIERLRRMGVAAVEELYTLGLKTHATRT